MPLSFGPVTVCANISGAFHASSTLRLSAPVAAGIFQGDITTWDHPDILALNPNLTCVSWSSALPLVGLHTERTGPHQGKGCVLCCAFMERPLRACGCPSCQGARVLPACSSCAARLASRTPATHAQETSATKEAALIYRHTPVDRWPLRDEPSGELYLSDKHAVWCLYRKLVPPIAPGTRISVVVRSDSSAAAYSFSQWLQAASNHTWVLGINKTLPSFPGAKVVSGGTAVTSYIGSTPFSIG